MKPFHETDFIFLQKKDFRPLKPKSISRKLWNHE